jgi:hypothetical protein
VARKLFPAAEEVIKAAVAADVQAYLGWG